MKKKRNFLLLILAVLLIGLGAGSTTVSAFSLPQLQNAESGQVVQRGRYYYYRYTDKTYARNQYLRINKRLCYFNKSGRRRAVRSCACCKRHSSILRWCPDNSTSGTFQPL